MSVEAQNCIVTGASAHGNLRRFQVGATSLIADDVYDVTGKRIGSVEDLIFDTGNGCVRYAVLSLGGFLGFGCKRVAIPWFAVMSDPHNHRCIIDRAQLSLFGIGVIDADPWLQRDGKSI